MDKVGKTDLFIGDSSDAWKEWGLRNKGITAIVNVARDLNDPWFGGMVQYKVGLDDGSSTRLDDYVRAAILVLSLLESGEDRVLLHCHEGHSRTAAIATIVLAAKLYGRGGNLSYRTALEKAAETVIASRPLCAKMERAHESRLLPALKDVVIERLGL